jgi:hypothetical protein
MSIGLSQMNGLVGVAGAGPQLSRLLILNTSPDESSRISRR